MSAANDALDETNTPLVDVIEAANDWLFVVTVADRVVMRPAMDALVLAAVLSVVVIDAARDWLFVLTVDESVSNRPAIELLLLVTVALVVVMDDAKDWLFVVMVEPCEVILAEKEPDEVDCALYTSVIYAAAEDELAVSVALRTFKLAVNDWEF
jgi:hypothetical protein